MEQIIATHRVKPSSPTPLHLNTHKLSSLDQSMFPVYIPLIFFYQNEESEQPTEISRRLKQSLSEVLTMFYPFAGTLRENSYVDCNDSGIEMVEARIHARLSQFTEHPDVEELKQLLPIAKEKLLLLVKVSYFDCGGFAVGVCLGHKIGDVSSLNMFMNAWAATCRGDTSQIIHPSFDLALHFPPTHIFKTDDLNQETKYVNEKITTKRLVFEREKLEKLKKLQASNVKDPSSVEALSAFIWKTAIEASKAKSERGTTPFVATQAVNLRARTVPPVPDQTVGNCATTALATMSWEEDERESGVHLSKLRAAIRGLDGDYINRVIKDGEKLSRALGEVRDLFTAANCFFSSWWRFPFYEVDFGWGKPVWVGTCSFPFKNRVILMSTPSGDGIEAWITISPDNHHFIDLLRANSSDLLLHQNT